MKEKLPEMWELLEATVFKVMSKPSRVVVDSLRTDVSKLLRTDVNGPGLPCDLMYDDTGYSTRPFFDCCC